MEDTYHTFEVCEDRTSGFYIAWRNVGEPRMQFIGSKGNVRHWKTRELAEAHAERLRRGLSKMSTA